MPALGWATSSGPRRAACAYLMYVSLVTIAILGYAGDTLLRLARRRILAWQEQAA